ncbi:MAG TPA: phosphate ABC transporter permease PstA [Pirellulales bacterium]|jgi:phosphate transport system permease protein
MSSERLLSEQATSGTTAVVGGAAPIAGRRSGWRPVRTRQASAATSLAAQGEPMLWLAGGALAVALTMIVGLLVLVLYQGLLTFWPQPVVQLETDDGTIYLGEIADRRYYTPQQHMMAVLPHATADRAKLEANAHGGRFQQDKIRVENFELTNTHFVWVDAFRVRETTFPEWALVIERLTNGRFYGLPASFLIDGQEVASTPAEVWAKYQEFHAEVRSRWQQRVKLEHDELGHLGRREQEARIALRQQELDQGRDSPEYAAAERTLSATVNDAGAERTRIDAEIDRLNQENTRYALRLTTGDGQSQVLPLEGIVRAYPANQLTTLAGLQVYLSRWHEFLLTDPRENSEGGVYPAIFGTVAMTLTMSLLVVPFGVLAALYLREYAKAGPIVSILRIAINNLAGVPSIVFGVFGLGLFCYILGAEIDQLFFRATLVETGRSTFGTGGILWASLTLALLTAPVVIVTTEEALAAVPNSMREGSYACGASKWQTIHRIVLPRAMPGIMTGMILAMARGAGEVAPIMLVGAMKLAPDLPVDSVFPYLHLERSFMHLGYHIYDLGFHSQNSVAAASMLFTTTLLLVAIVATLNVMAIWLRSRLRRRYVASHF